jgi:hypothetical protein
MIKRALLLAAAAALAVLLSAPTAGAVSRSACENRTNNTYAKLLECVTLDGVRSHQAELQAIANANSDANYPGTRAAGTAGSSASPMTMPNSPGGATTRPSS